MSVDTVAQDFCGKIQTTSRRRRLREFPTAQAYAVDFELCIKMQFCVRAIVHEPYKTGVSVQYLQRTIELTDKL